MPNLIGRWRQQVIRRKGRSTRDEEPFSRRDSFSIGGILSGESVLRKGERFFLEGASASRRTCAHGAYGTPYMRGNGNENTSRIYDGIAR